LGQLKQDVDQSSNNRCLAQADREAVERERLSYQSQRDALLDGRVLAEIRREYAQLLKEKNLRRRIASLEEERMRLQAGEPCPLCGATEHPYRQTAPAHSDALEGRIDALEKQLSDIECVEQALDQVTIKVQKANERMIEADKALEQINHSVTILAASEQRQQTNIKQLSQRQHQLKMELWTLISNANLDTMLDLDDSATPLLWQT